MESPTSPTRLDLLEREKTAKTEDKVSEKSTNFDEIFKTFASFRMDSYHPETECKSEENQATDAPPRPYNSGLKPDTNNTLGPDNTPLQQRSLFSEECKESGPTEENPLSWILNIPEEKLDEIKRTVVEKTMASILADKELRETFLGMDI